MAIRYQCGWSFSTTSICTNTPDLQFKTSEASRCSPLFCYGSARGSVRVDWLTRDRREWSPLNNSFRHSPDSLHTFTQAIDRCRVRNTDEPFRAKRRAIRHDRFLLLE